MPLVTSLGVICSFARPYFLRKRPVSLMVPIVSPGKNVIVSQRMGTGHFSHTLEAFSTPDSPRLCISLATDAEAVSRPTSNSLMHFHIRSATLGSSCWTKSTNLSRVFRWASAINCHWSVKDVANLRILYARSVSYRKSSSVKCMFHFTLLKHSQSIFSTLSTGRTSLLCLQLAAAEQNVHPLSHP